MIIVEKRIAELCETHGMTREQFAACVVEDLGSGVFRVDVKHPAFPRAGLGDMFSSALAAVGITKERVTAAVGRDCGCAGRQEALNALGRRIGIG